MVIWYVPVTPVLRRLREDPWSLLASKPSLFVKFWANGRCIK